MNEKSNKALVAGQIKRNQNQVIPLPVFTGPTEHVQTSDYGFDRPPQVGYDQFYRDMGKKPPVEDD